MVDQRLAAAQRLLVDRAVADRVERDREREDGGPERDEAGGRRAAARRARWPTAHEPGRSTAHEPDHHPDPGEVDHPVAALELADAPDVDGERTAEGAEAQRSPARAVGRAHRRPHDRPRRNAAAGPRPARRPCRRAPGAPATACGPARRPRGRSDVEAAPGDHRADLGVDEARRADGPRRTRPAAPSRPWSPER